MLAPAYMFTFSSLLMFLVSSWWRHQMKTFFALLAICAGNSPVPGEFPTQRSVMRSFDVFFDLRLNKRLSKQPWGWWFETLSWSLWRHRNDVLCFFAAALPLFGTRCVYFMQYCSFRNPELFVFINMHISEKLKYCKWKSLGENVNQSCKIQVSEGIWYNVVKDCSISKW